MGKGTLLRRAAEHMADLAEKVAGFDVELAKHVAEKAEVQVMSSLFNPTDRPADRLQSELTHIQNRLADEHSRSIRYETSWRDAEDRAASSQFELERVKGELEALRK